LLFGGKLVTITSVLHETNLRFFSFGQSAKPSLQANQIGLLFSLRAAAKQNYKLRNEVDVCSFERRYGDELADTDKGS
jgi:hypothetical protein